MNCIFRKYRRRGRGRLLRNDNELIPRTYTVKSYRARKQIRIKTIIGYTTIFLAAAFALVIILLTLFDAV